jgi:hypothetical protein
VSNCRIQDDYAKHRQQNRGKKKRPPEVAGEAFLLSHIKAPAQGGKAGSAIAPIDNLAKLTGLLNEKSALMLLNSYKSVSKGVESVVLGTDDSDALSVLTRAETSWP